MRLLKSLTRGLKTIDYLVERGEPARLTDIAAHLGVDKSNASHLMRTLMAAGYAHRSADRRYGIGPKLMRDRGLRLEDVIALKEGLHETLESLVAESQECAHLAVLVGDRVWYIDEVASPLPLKVDHPVGTLSPLHCTALGKSFLAFGDAAVPHRLERYTEATITDHDTLDREIAQTRARGFAIDNEEFAAGIRCVATWVENDRGEMVAAIGLSGPAARLDPVRLRSLGGLIIGHCRERPATPRAQEA